MQATIPTVLATLESSASPMSLSPWFNTFAAYISHTRTDKTLLAFSDIDCVELWCYAGVGRLRRVDTFIKACHSGRTSNMPVGMIPPTSWVPEMIVSSITTLIDEGELITCSQTPFLPTRKTTRGT